MSFPTTSTDGGASVTEQASARERFAEWRRSRPFAGGVLLMVSGLLIAYVPLHFATELLLIGGAFTFIGLLFAVLVFLTGVFALYRPEFSTMIGVIGIAMSILSIFGALGGLVVGMLLGIVGGNLCVAWTDEADVETGENGGNESTDDPGGDASD